VNSGSGYSADYQTGFESGKLLFLSRFCHALSFWLEYSCLDLNNSNAIIFLPCINNLGFSFFDSRKISSEDWARKYQFDDMVWPQRNCKSIASNNSETCCTTQNVCGAMSAFTPAAVDDALSAATATRHGGTASSKTVICAMGGSSSGKMKTLFGSSSESLCKHFCPPKMDNYYRYWQSTMSCWSWSFKWMHS